ncbi:hypothetical protein [Nonlabens sp. Hel1_33_55]|uniref:hypothetical protein n=1 Tax=Nonlabens sp. Hel1_33_55 TaxID=1336802 RepID=UPI0012FDAC0C|nr:hypothetical protein [Nonlabens sp. Hel1_33_55]
MNITRYTSVYKNQWDDFIRKSASGCFLHERDFMEYHADRFVDHSLMIWNEDELVACFPAHISNKVLKSHRGLTYASLLVDREESQFDQILAELIHYVRQQQFDSLELKLPPPFYNANFDWEWSILKNSGFKTSLESVDLVVDFTHDWQPSRKKTIGYRNGKFEKLKLVKYLSLKDFWSDLLEPQLMSRHQAKPTHNIEEIQLLQDYFNSKILQYGVVYNRELVAGITLFDFDHILKIQYAAGNKKGFELNAMDFLYLEIIKEAKEQGRKYVDLGTVNHPDGSLNEGLLRFKKQLGAVTTPVHELTLDLRS